MILSPQTITSCLQMNQKSQDDLNLHECVVLLKSCCGICSVSPPASLWMHSTCSTTCFFTSSSHLAEPTSALSQYRENHLDCVPHRAAPRPASCDKASDLTSRTMEQADTDTVVMLLHQPAADGARRFFTVTYEPELYQACVSLCPALTIHHTQDRATDSLMLFVQMNSSVPHSLIIGDLGTTFRHINCHYKISCHIQCFQKIRKKENLHCSFLLTNNCSTLNQITIKLQ